MVKRRVCWFGAGPIPAQTSEWFQRRAAGAALQQTRTDFYFHYLGLATIGTKLREGNIEQKVRVIDRGLQHISDHVTGHVEHWNKWSFQLSELDRNIQEIEAGDDTWIAVDKVRLLVKYAVTVDHRVVPVSPESWLTEGCTVEAVRIRARNRDWWSLGFEAFGRASVLEETLFRVATHILDGDDTPHLSASASFSYPEWLMSVQ